LSGDDVTGLFGWAGKINENSLVLFWLGRYWKKSGVIGAVGKED